MLCKNHAIKTRKLTFDAQFMNINLSKRIEKDYGLAKIITANNAFAHMDDLIGMLKSITA